MPDCFSGVADLGAFDVQRGRDHGIGTFNQVRAAYGECADVILAANPHATDAEALRSAQNLMRDSTFAWSTWAWAKLQSQQGKGKAYVYYFDHPTPQTPNGSYHAGSAPSVAMNDAL